MYYNRKLSASFSKLIEKGGELRWLFDFVKNHEDLDFQVGKNNAQEWISVYRGTSRIIKIQPMKDPRKIKLDGEITYKKKYPSLYGIKNITVNFQKDLDVITRMIHCDPKFDQYYNNKKEGYYQNILSRKYGICGQPTDDFVIIDKEAVVGYTNQAEKVKLMGTIQSKYKLLQKEISHFNAKLYGNNLDKKAIGNELDFLALDKEGNILLIEYKHGTNASGIYLSPLQIGMYYDIFTGLIKANFFNAVLDMLVQKQKIGLINPKWVIPSKSKEIIPVLIISEFNYNSTAKIRFDEIIDFVRKKHGVKFLKNLQTLNFTIKPDLSSW